METKDLLEKDVTKLVEEKKGFNYLPWAVAWEAVLKIDDKATYTVDRNSIDGLQCFGNPDMGYTVYTTLTFQGVAREMYLPVFKGEKSIKKPDTFQINTAVMRCLVKNIAAFGLGLTVYIGEDIPKPGLTSYDSSESTVKLDINEEVVIILDVKEEKPIVTKEDVPNKVIVKKDPVTPVIPKYEQQFIIAVNARKDFTQSKKDRLLNDDSITKIIKQEFVKTGKGL